MENRNFRITGYDLAARRGRLDSDKAHALDEALERLSGATGGEPSGGDGEDGKGLAVFLLPLAEFGLSATQIVKLVEKIPVGFPRDHREIYFDFRLERWIRHIEPPTIAQSLEEYLESAETPADGIAYLREQWRAFLRRHGADAGG